MAGLAVLAGYDDGLAAQSTRFGGWLQVQDVDRDSRVGVWSGGDQG
jgi:hypothetical protein